MGRVTAEVRALLQERQDRHKEELDAHRRDVRFAVGDEVLLVTEHAPLAAFAALDWPLQGARVPGAQHLSP
jgi:hypothetical protein